MLEIIAIVLLLLWLAGAFVVPFGGSAIHLVLFVALALILIRLLSNGTRY